MIFHNLLEAMSYVKYCPLCNYPLTIENHTSHMYRDGDELVSENNSLNIRINLYTENFSIQEIQSIDTVYGFNTNPSTTISGPKTQIGTLFLGVKMACPNKDCGQYAYVFRMQLNTKKPYISDIMLNVEYLTLDKDGQTHEMRNSYETGETRYCLIKSDLSGPYNYKDKAIILPFINFDLSDPYKTLDKIKNLIIFT